MYRPSSSCENDEVKGVWGFGFPRHCYFPVKQNELEEKCSNGTWQAITPPDGFTCPMKANITFRRPAPVDAAWACYQNHDNEAACNNNSSGKCTWYSNNKSILWGRNGAAQEGACTSSDPDVDNCGLITTVAAQL